MNVLIVRYGEISLKSHSVRRRFTEKLIENIQSALMKSGIEGYIEEERGRIYLFTDDEKAADTVKNVFGVVSVSPAKMTAAEMEDIAELACSMFACGRLSFAVRATRHGSHRYTSQELAAYVGEKMLDRCDDLRVNLGKPDFEVFIEVRNSRAFVFSKKIPGVGGMPLGTQGTVASYMRDRSDLLSAWMIMKRGCRLLFPTDAPPDLRHFAEKWGAIPVSESMGDILKRAGVLALVSGRVEDCKKVFSVPVLCPIAGLSEKDLEDRLNLIFS